jgi:hypothetical protein
LHPCNGAKCKDKWGSIYEDLKKIHDYTQGIGHNEVYWDLSFVDKMMHNLYQKTTSFHVQNDWRFNGEDRAHFSFASCLWSYVRRGWCLHSTYTLTRQISWWQQYGFYNVTNESP